MCFFLRVGIAPLRAPTLTERNLSDLVISADTPTRSSRVGRMSAKSPSLSCRSSSARLQCCERVAIFGSCARCADALCVCVERLAHSTLAPYSPRQAKSRLAAALISGMVSFSETPLPDAVISSRFSGFPRSSGASDQRCAGLLLMWTCPTRSCTVAVYSYPSRTYLISHSSP